MTVIFCMSAKNAQDSSEMSLTVGRTICGIFVSGYENLPEETQTAYAKNIEFPIRKGAHVFEFTVLGFLLGGFFLAEKKIRVTEGQGLFFCICAFGAGVFYAITDEIHQLFVPGRAGRAIDVGIDSTGVLLGVFVIAFFHSLCYNRLVKNYR